MKYLFILVLVMGITICMACLVVSVVMGEYLMGLAFMVFIPLLTIEMHKTLEDINDY